MIRTGSISGFGEAYQYAKSIEGWYGPDECELLWMAAWQMAGRGLPYLEIGSYYGRSASLLLRHQMTVLVDSSALWGNPNGTYLRDGLEEQHHGLCANLEGLPYILVPVPSQQVMMGTPRFALIHIDGDHTKGGVDRDCEKYLPLLETSGLACWHDYEKGNFPDVVEAVDRFTGGWVEFGRAGSLMVKVKP